MKAPAALETTGAKYTFRGSSLVKDYHHQIVFSIDGRIKSPATLYHPKTEAFDTAMVRYNLDLVCHSSRQDAWVAAQQMNPRTQSHCLGRGGSFLYASQSPPLIVMPMLCRVR